MARTSIYVPNFLHRWFKTELPPDETLSGLATAALAARKRRAEGCDHSGGRLLCGECHAPVVDPAG